MLIGRVNTSGFINKFIEKLIYIITYLIVFTTKKQCLCVSLILTSLFYLPSLFSGGKNAGFLYTGDVLGWYLPALAKTHSLIHSFTFSGIDYSTFNGSSDFFLSPNFFAYHPLVIVFSLLTSPELISQKALGCYFLILMAIHTFIAFYYTIKLFIRFFHFEFLESVLVGVVFAFSMHMLNALGQPVFLLCATVVPWVAYASLSYVENSNFKQLVLAILPVIFAILGGYMPLAFACLGYSLIVVFAKILYFDSKVIAFDSNVRELLKAITPLIFAVFITAPYIFSVVDFHKDTLSAGVGSLFYSAHQYAQSPQSLLSIFSSHLFVPGPESEFSVLWGFIVISTTIIFLLGVNNSNSLSKNEWNLIKISLVTYFATVIASLGDFSVVSDLVYYLIPQIGRMHVYQRFFLPAELFLGVFFVLSLKAVVLERPLKVIRFLIITFGILFLILAYVQAFNPDYAAKIGLNNYVLIEILFGLFFLCSLLIPSKNFIYAITSVLFCLPLLNRMYDYSKEELSLEMQAKSKVVALNEQEQERIVNYLKTQTKKDVIKYVDITSMWKSGTVTELYSDNGIETFTKVFPYYILKSQKVSSYGGFTFYLSARADYMHKMPVVGEEIAVSPDWEYLNNTGADFLVATEQDLKQGAIRSLVSNTKQEDILRLPNEVVILPLRFVSENLATPKASLFDNGYFKISHQAKDVNNGLENIALGKPAKQSSDAGADPKRAVDGNTDGEFSHGSASHTLRDINAWFEVDLGKSELIDSINIWNRTDCCGYCLRDYWLFISDTPFKAEDTASKLSVRPATWHQQNFAPNPKGAVKTAGAKGRYVRVQLPGDAKTLKECFLSLAEVEVFRAKATDFSASEENSVAKADFEMKNSFSNYASYLVVEFTSSVPTDVAYLFWNNPRLSYYLNGKEVQVKQRDGVTFIEAPAGKNKIEIRYRHWPLRVFWVFYSLYFILLSLVVLVTILPIKIKESLVRKFNRFR